MSGPLVRFAVISLAVSAVCLGLAARLGPGLNDSDARRVGRCSALTHMLDLIGAGDDGDTGGNTDGSGPSTASLAWEPRDAIDIALPAQVNYRPGPQPEATVSGDAKLISHVRLEGGRLDWDRTADCLPRGALTIRLRGPAVQDWKLTGSAALDLADIKQDRIAITTRGSSRVVAAGEVGELTLAISGSGRADLSRLAAQRAEARLRGSAVAEIAAREEADISIAGSATLRLHGRPLHMRSHVSGSGGIEQLP